MSEENQMDIDSVRPFNGSASQEADLLASPRPEAAAESLPGDQHRHESESGQPTASEFIIARKRKTKAKAAVKNIPVSEAGVSDPETLRGKKEMTKMNQASGGNVTKPKGDGAQGGGSNKRQLPSPNTSVPKPKKQQVKGKQSFAQAVKSNWTVFIRSPSGDLDDDCLANLRQAICEKIDAIPPDQVKPTFEANFSSGGAFKMVCSNELSRTWLVKTVQEIGNIGGVEITTGKSACFRMVLTLPDSSGLSMDKIFDRLASQNVGLKTQKWKLLQEMNSAKPGWRTIFIGIDQETTTFVSKAKGRLYYMMQTVKADVRKPKGFTEAENGRK